MTDKNNLRYFVDYNVWLYAFSTKQKEDRKRLLAKQLIQGKSIVISTQVINEVCCNLIKKYKVNEPKDLSASQILPSPPCPPYRYYMDNIACPVTGVGRLETDLSGKEFPRHPTLPPIYI